jgi:competence protein CoiA
MKFADVEGVRREAQRGLPAKCPVCGNAMVAKCGRHRVHHWAHRGIRTCDHWWESETEWHRVWKNHFPEGCQEFVHTSEDGEKHIADVKTDRGVVLEFQHSHLRREERESRENFYPSMVWVVDGQRRARDRARFFASLHAAKVVCREPPIVSVPVLWNECALLRDWYPSRVSVYFDFGDSEPGDTARFDEPTLWRLNPGGQNGRAYLSPVPKSLFLKMHLEGLPFDERACTETIDRAVATFLMQQAPRPGPLAGFERHWARSQRARRRL